MSCNDCEESAERELTALQTVMGYVDQISTAVAAPIGGQLEELARLFERSTNVVVEPSETVITGTTLVPQGPTQQPVQLLAPSLDRLRVTLIPFTLNQADLTQNGFLGLGVNREIPAANALAPIPTNLMVVPAPNLGGPVAKQEYVFHTRAGLFVTAFTGNVYVSWAVELR